MRGVQVFLDNEDAEDAEGVAQLGLLAHSCAGLVESALYSGMPSGDTASITGQYLVPLG